MNRSPLIRWLIFAGCFAAAYAAFTVWRVQRFEHDAAEASTRGLSAGSAEAQDQTSAGPADAGTNEHGTATGGRHANDTSAAPLPSFKLTGQDGQEFDSSSLRGHVWVGSFFFTNCPSVCFRLNQIIAGLQSANPDSDTRYVSISCDPDHDTPEALDRYARHFHADPARWTFLTGDMKTIGQIGNQMFRVSVERATHSDRAVVVDRSGHVRGRLRLTEPDQLEKLKRLLAQVESEQTAEALPTETRPTDTASTAAPPTETPPAAASSAQTPTETSGSGAATNAPPAEAAP